MKNEPSLTTRWARYNSDIFSGYISAPERFECLNYLKYHIWIPYQVVIRLSWSMTVTSRLWIATSLHMWVSNVHK